MLNLDPPGQDESLINQFEEYMETYNWTNREFRECEWMQVICIATFSYLQIFFGSTGNTLFKMFNGELTKLESGFLIAYLALFFFIIFSSIGHHFKNEKQKDEIRMVLLYSFLQLGFMSAATLCGFIFWASFHKEWIAPNIVSFWIGVVIMILIMVFIGAIKRGFDWWLGNKQDVGIEIPNYDGY